MPSAVVKRQASEISSVEDFDENASVASTQVSNASRKRARLGRGGAVTNGGLDGDHDEEGEEDDDDEEEEDEEEDGYVKSEGNILPAADPDEEEEDILGREGLEIGPNTQPFQPGSIVRIKVKNFVTYSQVEVFPGPNLNMVIGPNGTGKSTIVCAVCLGLGWGPVHLGRAKEISEFVKHGSQEAKIEIELQGKDGERNPIIQRRIIREGNVSSYTLNGKTITGAKLLAFTRSYNIQIDNLCQFLPQDRVVEFAGLSTIELLKETQRAAAPPDVLEKHDKLKKLGKGLKELSNEFDIDQGHLKAMESKQAALQQDVERLRERQEVIKKIELLEKAKPFMSYRAARARTKETKEAYKAAVKELEQLKEEIQPMTDAPRLKKRYRDTLEKCVKERKELVDEKEREIAKYADKTFPKFEEDGKKIENEMEAERKQENERKESIRRLRERIQKIKRSLENEPAPIDLKLYNQQLAEKQREVRELFQQAEDKGNEIKPKLDSASQIQGQIESANRELSALETASGQRENMLKQQSMDTFRAWDYYKNHRDDFEQEVFGPPILTCSVKDPRHADAVESLFGGSDKKALVCQNKNDYRRLVDACFGNVNKGIQGMELADVTIKEYSSTRAPTLAQQPPGPVSTEELTRYGFDGYALDYLEGPEPVLNMLCHEIGIHRTPICSRDFTPQQNKNMENTPISSWIAGRTVYRIIRRKEYNATSTRVVSLKSAHIFKVQQVDHSLKTEIQRRIHELLDELTNIKQEIEVKKGEHHQLKQVHQAAQVERKAIENEKAQKQLEVSKWTKLKASLEPAEEELKQKLTGGENYKSNMQALNNKQSELAVKKAKEALEYGRVIKELVELHHDLIQVQLREVEAGSDLEILEARIAETKKRLEQKEKEVNELKAASAAIQAEAKAFFKQCQKIADDLSDAETEFMNNIPMEKTNADIENDIEVETARLELLHEGNPNAIKQYEDRQVKITALKAKIEGQEERLTSMKQKIERLRGQWEPEIDRLIAKISSAFTRSFEKIGCAGEVKVHKDEDFDKWAVQILVKFREKEKLQILTNQRQSGGERAVSTVFYLMALQSLARSPFRVVDEINQGMDPRNERLVHHRMVNIACQEHTSQYFLITPKLLPDLMYHPRMKIHCINSGDWIEENSILDHKKYLKIGSVLKAQGVVV